MEVIGEIFGYIIIGIIRAIFHAIFVAIRLVMVWVYLRIRYRTQTERDAAEQRFLAWYETFEIGDYLAVLLLAIAFFGVAWLIFFILKDIFIKF